MENALDDEIERILGNFYNYLNDKLEEWELHEYHLEEDFYSSLSPVELTQFINLFEDFGNNQVPSYALHQIFCEWLASHPDDFRRLVSLKGKRRH